MIVKSPIKKTLVAESHPSYYRMHKYWARKPANIVNAYINHYTKEGDIVLDPFLGSGVTAIESLLLKRKAIGFDINPMSKKITCSSISNFDKEELQTTFDFISSQIREKINSLFETEINGLKFVASHFVWERYGSCPTCKSKIYLFSSEKDGRRYVCSNCKELVSINSSMVLGDRMIEVWYYNNSGDKIIKKPNTKDLKRYKKIINCNTNSALNNNFMFENKRILVNKSMKIEDLFTKRNLIAISMIKDQIDLIENKKIKTVFELVFSSSIAQSSKLIPYRNSLSSGGPAWTVSGFWIPKKHFEINAWNNFKNRFNSILKGKYDISQKECFSEIEEVLSWDELEGSNKSASLIMVKDSKNMKSIIPSNSINYIFTDPPYGDNVPYLEYSAIWNSWFNDEVKFEDEIIISDSNEREKGFEDYRYGLNKVFEECFRVLKPKSWISITFNNKNFEVWNALIKSIVLSGLTIKNAVYQIPAVIPAKAQLSKGGSSVGDIIINAQKISSNKKINEKKLDLNKFKSFIKKLSRKYILYRGGMATTDQINRSIVIKLIEKKIYYFDKIDLNSILKEDLFFDKGFWKIDKDISEINIESPLFEEIKKIVINCWDKGMYDKKNIIKEVFNNINGSNAPELGDIIFVIDSTPETGKTLNIFD